MLRESTEQLSAINIKQNQQAGIAQMKSGLSQIFDSKYKIVAGQGPMVGRDGVGSITFSIVGPNPSNGIDQNSPVFTIGMMHLTDNFGRVGDLNSVSWELIQAPRSLKFRKITSKISIEDANNKMLAWLKANKANYDNLLTTGKNPWEK